MRYETPKYKLMNQTMLCTLPLQTQRNEWD